jgi:hypothetical protein
VPEDRRRCEVTLPLEVLEVFREMDRSQLGGLVDVASAQVFDEVAEVAAVRVKRGDGQAAFDAEVGEEVADVG